MEDNLIFLQSSIIILMKNIVGACKAHVKGVCAFLVTNLVPLGIQKCLFTILFESPWHPLFVGGVVCHSQGYFFPLFLPRKLQLGPFCYWYFNFNFYFYLFIIFVLGSFIKFYLFSISSFYPNFSYFIFFNCDLTLDFFLFFCQSYFRFNFTLQ